MYSSYTAIIALIARDKSIPENGLVGYAMHLNNLTYKNKSVKININKNILKRLREIHDLNFVTSYFKIKSLKFNTALTYVLSYLVSDYKYVIKAKHFSPGKISLIEITDQELMKYENNKIVFFKKNLNHIIMKSISYSGLFIITLHMAFKLSLFFPTMSIGILPFMFALVISKYIYSTFIKPTLIYNLVLNTQSLNRSDNFIESTSSQTYELSA